MYACIKYLGCPHDVIAVIACPWKLRKRQTGLKSEMCRLGRGVNYIPGHLVGHKCRTPDHDSLCWGGVFLKDCMHAEIPRSVASFKPVHIIQEEMKVTLSKRFCCVNMFTCGLGFAIAVLFCVLSVFAMRVAVHRQPCWIWHMYATFRLSPQRLAQPERSTFTLRLQVSNTSYLPNITNTIPHAQAPHAPRLML